MADQPPEATPPLPGMEVSESDEAVKVILPKVEIVATGQSAIPQEYALPTFVGGKGALAQFPNSEAIWLYLQQEQNRREGVLVTLTVNNLEAAKNAAEHELKQLREKYQLECIETAKLRRDLVHERRITKSQAFLQILGNILNAIGIKLILDKPPVEAGWAILLLGVSIIVVAIFALKGGKSD